MTITKAQRKELDKLIEKLVKVSIDEANCGSQPKEDWALYELDLRDAKDELRGFLDGLEIT